jgi:hypothetical protein
MCADDADHGSFEERLRSIAQEIGRSVERAAEQVDVDDFAGFVGVDPDRAREWVESAGSWLRAQAENLGDEVAFEHSRSPQDSEKPGAARPRRDTSDEDPLRGAGPHPLDLPTEEQGLALAALNSGRWTVEPGSAALAAHGEGPGPSDALGLVRELQVRDWIGSDGEMTLVGRHALSRWLEGAAR